MDPVSAIGLASSIVQLISFAGNLVSKSREIYRAVDGSLVEHAELEIVAKTLQSQSRRIASQSGNLSGTTETVAQLLQLCEGIRKLSKELIETIEKVKADGQPNKWSSFRQALRSVCKEHDIADLLQRLERYRRQLDSLLLLYLQEKLESDSREAASRSDRIEQNFNKLLASIQPRDKWHYDIVDAARKTLGAAAADQELDAFSDSLSAGAKQDREAFVKRRIFQSLKFNDMRDRYELIPEAHKNTFEWVFREPGDAQNDGEGWDNFATWLMKNELLYWITGKPGSGKSTLMKFLSDDQRLRRSLRFWAGHEPLYIGRFFFWNSGTTMQMSRIGLLQSLLYQTVTTLLDEIPRLFPDRWQYQEFFGHDPHPWTWSELSGAFTTLISEESRKFFFLIDGLDEFDGDCGELAQFLLGILSKTSNVKLCVASRPWLVFEDAFRRRPSLRVEDLTLRDIRVFASEKLSEHVMFEQLQELDSEKAQKLIEEVTVKSSGVFLWVRLVVKSLLDGLRDGDTVEDLQARLLDLPPDLEALFQKMLSDLDTAYFEEASQIFQTVRASHIPWRQINLNSKNILLSDDETTKQESDSWSPLALLSLSFVGEDVQRALDLKYGDPMPEKEQWYRAEAMRRRLHSRCKGLLEAPGFKRYGPEAKVQYLHRTVKDFLDEDRARQFLSAGSGGFDPNVALCAAILRHTKAICPIEGEMSGMTSFEGLVRQFLIQCHWFEKEDCGDYAPFLKEMDRTTKIILGYDDMDCRPSGSGKGPKLPHWTRRVDPYVGRGGFQIWCLFDYASIRSLRHYVERELGDGYDFDSNPNKDYLAAKAPEGVAEILTSYKHRHYRQPWQRRSSKVSSSDAATLVASPPYAESQTQPVGKLKARGAIRRLWGGIHFRTKG